MLKYIFGTLDYGTLLFFGVFVSAAFLDIQFNKKNIAVLSIFSIICLALQISIYWSLGLEGTAWLYPFITHAPLVLLLFLYFKRNFLSCVFSVMSAYLCCQLSKWISLIVTELSEQQLLDYIIHSLLTLILGVIIIRFFASSVSVILTKSIKTRLIFCIIPVVYYLFDYLANVYTNLLYNGSEAVFEFLPFVLCVAYLIFCVVYFKEYEEKCEAERLNEMMKMKRSQTEKEIEAIKRSEYSVALLRHDMRHFLINIFSYIENGDSEKAKTYIKEIINSADKTALEKYCDNDIVNMIISSYENKIKEHKITLNHNIKIPSTLPIPDVDFTSILSNGLENAIKAVSEIDEDKRAIFLDLYMNDGKLLISLKNPYSRILVMQDGLPLATEKGHGLGTRSIKHVTEKLHGNCQFLAQDGQFTLRVIL